MNKDEIAMDYKKELKKRISADYERRVKQWMAADPSQLIDAAEEITAARLIRDNIEDAINEEDARFLLGLDEPLDELADRWIAENGLDASHGEELLHCVWTLREELSDDAGPCTVRDFLAAHVGGVFSLITPDIGADYYIAKPFSPGEVMARIRAVLRRIPACPVSRCRSLPTIFLVRRSTAPTTQTACGTS